MLQTPPSQDFINETTILTFSVSTFAVFAVGVAFRKVFKINHPAVPFVTSLAISFALAGTKGSLGTPMGWLIAFLNACVLFCAGIGANETATDIGTEKPAGGGEQQGGRPQRMSALKSYFRR